MKLPLLAILHACVCVCVRGSGGPRQRRMQHLAAHRLTVITKVWKLVFHKRGLPASPPPMTGAERTCGGGSPTGCPLHRHPRLPRPTAPPLVLLPTGERPRVSRVAGGSCCGLRPSTLLAPPWRSLSWCPASSFRFFFQLLGS